MYGLVKEFMQKWDKEWYTNPMLSDFFIVLCQSVYDIVESNTDGNGFVDRNGIISDTNDLIFQPLFLPMLKNNEELMKKLEEQMKYSSCSKIMFTDELKKIMEE